MYYQETNKPYQALDQSPFLLCKNLKAILTKPKIIISFKNEIDPKIVIESKNIKKLNICSKTK